MVTPSDIKSWIEAGLPEAVVSVDGDGHHFYALILFNGFEGKSLIQRHRVVRIVIIRKVITKIIINRRHPYKLWNLVVILLVMNLMVVPVAVEE